MAKRAGFILCLVVCALGVGASHARADSPPPPAVIAAGVQIGSVDVSGLTAEQATAAVQQAYFAPVVLHVGHRSYSVSPHHFHAALGGLDSAVQAALTAPALTTIRLTPTLDTKRVAKWVKTLAGKTYRAPVAGRLLLRHNRPFFTLAHPGRALRPFPTRMLIRDAVVSGDHTAIVAPVKTLSAAAVKSMPVIVIHRGIEPPLPLQRHSPGTRLPGGHGAGRLADSAGPVPDRRQAEEPVVVPADAGFMGRWGQAGPARA